MKSFLVCVIALLIVISAAPAVSSTSSAPYPQAGKDCPNLGEMQCCGIGFITCDYSGWIYRDCAVDTVCYPPTVHCSADTNRVLASFELMRWAFDYNPV